MSDTLQERESGATTACGCGRLGHSEQVRGLPKGTRVKAITDIAQLGENVRTGTKGTVTGHCSDGRAIIFFDGFPHGHTFHTPNGYMDLLTDETATTDYCDECKGRPHAPWCSEYKEPNTRRSGEMGHRTNHEQAATSHQPAARGGGEEWRTVDMTDTEFDSRPCWTIEQEGQPLLATAYSKEVAHQIITEHNAHQSLVAEIDALKGEALALVAERESLLTALRQTHNAALVFVDSRHLETAHQGLLDIAADIEKVLSANEQRSTSE
jgi:hypothetical protein